MGCYNQNRFPERKGAGTYEGMEENYGGCHHVILYAAAGRK